MLWGLTALSVPIIVHLFNFRKHKVIYFPFTSFLSEVKTESQKKSKIRHWIILLLRLLAITAIVMAFAQPILPHEHGNSGKKLVSIYIDNSLSMENSKQEIALLEHAKNKALDIVFAYNENDQFQIISNEFTGIQQHYVSKNKAIEIIQSVQLCAIERPIDMVWERQKDLFEKDQNPNKKVFWISDFQKSTCPLDKLELQNEIDYRWIPVQNNETPNVYVDSVYFESPAHLLGQEEMLWVSLKNSSTTDIQNTRCELNIDNQNKGVTSVSIAAGGSQKISFPLTPSRTGVQVGTVILNDSPVQFDNRHYFTYEVGSSRNIGILGNSPHALEVFNNDPNFKTTLYSVSNINVEEWIKNEVLIIENAGDVSSGIMAAAIDATKQGRTLIIIPNLDQLEQWKTYLTSLNFGSNWEKMNQSMSGKEIDLNSPLYKNIFDTKNNFNLPSSESHWTWKKSSNLFSVASYYNGDPMICYTQVDNGQVWLINVDYRNTNLFNHSLFPISLLRMSELSAFPQPLSFTLGQGTPLKLKNLKLDGNTQLKLKHTTTQETFIPLVRNIKNNTEISMGPFLPQSGHYDVIWNEKSLYTIGVNAGKNESQLAFFNREELESIQQNFSGDFGLSIIDENTENIGNLVTKMDEGQHLWWYLIVLAIALIISESILIGIWKM